MSLLLLLASARGATVLTRDGKSFEGEAQFSAGGALVVTSTQREPATIELTNLARATFASGAFYSAGGTLPNGWLAQDMGEARGFARLDGASFTLRVEGRSTNATAGHFVSRAMPSDGQIVVRVDEVGGDAETRAGVMIRGQNNSSPFASLALGRDGRLWFQRRTENDRKEILLTPGPVVTAPVWLRLQKYDQTVTALYATDGLTWQTLAKDKLKLPPEKTWRESEGDLYLMRASCGVFASSRGRDTLGTARVTPLSMALHGLLGEYFSDQQFGNLRLARLDPQIDFNWKLGSPDPALDKDNFSVRWTGKIIPARSGGYNFYFDTEDRARLWINGEEIPQARFKKDANAIPHRPMSFLAGQGVQVKMEFEESDGPASVRLGWSRSGEEPQVIPMTNFIHIFTATNSPESIAAARLATNTPSGRGVLLRDGTFLAGTVAKADESAVRISFVGRKDVPVLNSKVARLYLRPPRQTLPFDITLGRSGVFMKTGDFFEAEFRGIDGTTLTTSSVLFGLKRFNIEGGEPLVVILNDCTPASSGFEVKLLDGSNLRATALITTAQMVTAETAILGRVSVPVTELFEIRRVDPMTATAY